MPPGSTPSKNAPGRCSRRALGAGCCRLPKWSGRLNPSGANAGMTLLDAMAITDVTLRYIQAEAVGADDGGALDAPLVRKTVNPFGKHERPVSDLLQARTERAASRAGEHRGVVDGALVAFLAAAEETQGTRKRRWAEASPTNELLFAALGPPYLLAAATGLGSLAEV